MLSRLRELKRRHEVLGDVRGSGLFAILELVRDRHTRAPLAPWPMVHPGLNSLLTRTRERGVSFAVRGNLIILAPPLVIGENELSQALGILDTLLTEIDWT
jgi:taurine--2-oxoglutarate transaminase